MSQRLFGRKNELAKSDVTKPIISLPLQARPILVRFRKPLGNRQIFVLGATVRTKLTFKS